MSFLDLSKNSSYILEFLGNSVTLPILCRDIGFRGVMDKPETLRAKR